MPPEINNRLDGLSSVQAPMAADENWSTSSTMKLPTITLLQSGFAGLVAQPQSTKNCDAWSATSPGGGHLSWRWSTTTSNTR